MSIDGMMDLPMATKAIKEIKATRATKAIRVTETTRGIRSIDLLLFRRHPEKLPVITINKEKLRVVIRGDPKKEVCKFEGASTLVFGI